MHDRDGIGDLLDHREIVRHEEIGQSQGFLQLVEQSKGALKRGTVYVTLGRMQDKGYVESWTEKQPAGAIGLPRRLYRPTAYGLRVVAAWEAAARALTGPPKLRHA